MTPLEVISAKRAHLARLANQGGAAGEQDAIVLMEHWVPRPRAGQLQLLLQELATTGIVIKGSSFDALAVPEALLLIHSDNLQRISEKLDANE